MGSNRTQAQGLLFLLIAFVLLACTFAGGGILMLIGALAFMGIAVYLFLKCKPWEHNES